MAMKQRSACSSLDFHMTVLMYRSVDVLIFTHCGGSSLIYFFTEIRKAFTVRVQQNSSA